MKISGISLSWFVFLSFFFAIPAFAQVKTYYPTIDAPPIHVIGVANFDRVAMKSLDGNGRSYCCEMNNPIDSSETTGGKFASFSNFIYVTPTLRGDNIPRVSADDCRNRRYCWADDDDDDGGFTIKYGVLGGITDTASLYISCVETTLYGNYNTSVSEYNFLEITARSEQTAWTGGDINGVITLKSSITGNKIATPFRLDFTEETGTRFRTDYSVHDILGGAADFGEIIIRHDGSPGQLTARISQYDLISTSPLNFILVGHADLKQGSSK